MPKTATVQLASDPDSPACPLLQCLLTADLFVRAKGNGRPLGTRTAIWTYGLLSLQRFLEHDQDFSHIHQEKPGQRPAYFPFLGFCILHVLPSSGVRSLFIAKFGSYHALSAKRIVRAEALDMNRPPLVGGREEIDPRPLCRWSLDKKRMVVPQRYGQVSPGISHHQKGTSPWAWIYLLDTDGHDSGCTSNLVQ